MRLFVHFPGHSANKIRQIKALLTGKGVQLLYGYFASIQTVIDKIDIVNRGLE